MGFIINVAELMIMTLPRPRLKCKVLDQDRSETLDQLGIIKVSGKDGDYYGADKTNRLHPMVQ